MLRRLITVLLVVLTLAVAGCGGSDGASDPDAISETDALTRAEEAAVAEGLSTEGLSVTPTLIFGEWQVSYTPEDSAELAGGFLIALNSTTGEVLDVIPYR